MNLEEKYEPKVFAELVFADEVAHDMCKRYGFGKPYKPLMLWGEPGSAKTSTARVIARERFAAGGDQSTIDEFNCAELTVEDLFKLENAASFQRVNFGDNIIVLNEFDEIPKEDQPKWRSWMDRFKWVNLVVTTNEKPNIKGVRQKLMPAIISRFECVELSPPTVSDWLPRAKHIFAQEGFTVNNAQLHYLLQTFTGDVREALPLIEQGLETLKANGGATPPVLTVVPKVPSETPTP